MTVRQEREFIPALKYDVLTPLYDVAIALTVPERRFKRRLLDAARLAAGQRVLDVGCGTGTLLRLAAQSRPDAEFVGLSLTADTSGGLIASCVVGTVRRFLIWRSRYS